MSFSRFSAPLIGAISAFALSFTPLASAQDEDLPELVQNSILLMRQENWAEALKLNEQAINNFGRNAFAIYGARFGGIYYRKGVCELKLQKWDKAMKSFEICYKEFPNKGDADNINPFEKTCLLQWAEAAMGKEEWQQALDLFEKFLKERDKNRDQFSPKQQGSFYISLAICYYNLGELAEANENFEIVIKNKDRFKVPDSLILNAFRYLVNAVIKDGNEQVLIDFVDKNRGEIITDAYDMYPYASLFMKLATEAIKAGMPRAAIEIYQLIPSTEVALSDARAKLQDLGPLPRLRVRGGTTLIKEQLEKGIQQLEEAERGKKSLEIVKLAAIAYLHEQYGNSRGAYAAYRQLELYYPNAENQESNLFNLARTSFIVDLGEDNFKDARAFLKAYPDSKNAPLIQRLVLSSLFAQQQYEQCIESALSMIDSLKKNTPEHDLCLHVLGGSYFYSGQYEEAEKWLEEHAEMYPKSESAIAAAYFQASNAYRMGKLEKAGALLDEFTAKFPDAKENSFLAYADFDRATIYYLEDKNEEALKKVDSLIEQFGDSGVADQAHNLRGNILNVLEKPIEAEGAYLQALRLAERAGRKVVAGEAIYNLVDLLITSSSSKDGIGRREEALGYIEKFWKQYADGSPYAREMAVKQLPILEASDRLDEGIERLQKVITAMANNPDARGLDEKLEAYTEVYLKKHTPDELKDHYARFPGVPMKARAARALMQIQVISVYEKMAKKEQDPVAKTAANATIKALFDRLKEEFDVKDLSSAILIEVGNYLRQKTATPREALPFYGEVIQRNDQDKLLAALLGRADIYGQSGNPGDIEKALKDFKRIYDTTKDKKQREFALFRSIQLLMAKKDYEKASAQAREFLDREKGYSKSRHAPDVGLLLAQAFEARKMTEDAIAMYAKVWAVHPGSIRASAPAMEGWMRLLWDRNKGPESDAQYGDRQGAYVAGATYIKNTSPLKEKMTGEDLELWKKVEKLVEQYEANPKIKSLEQIEKEEKEGR